MAPVIWNISAIPQEGRDAQQCPVEMIYHSFPSDRIDITYHQLSTSEDTLIVKQE